MTLRGPNITVEFKDIVEDYIAKRFGTPGRTSRLERFPPDKGRGSAPKSLLVRIFCTKPVSLWWKML